MKEKQPSPQETLSEIKHLMERSSRFISLSGLSGVFAGIYALIGAFAAYSFIKLESIGSYATVNWMTDIKRAKLMQFFLLDASAVLILAVATGIYLTTRKAKRDGNSIFDAAAKKLIINLCIPLVSGGIFCLALIYHNLILYIGPSMLIFYGLALINASKYTRDDIRTLGIAEIILGLISSFMIGYGLLFWAFGFGVLHIVYGTYMYFKYEK